MGNHTIVYFNRVRFTMLTFEVCKSIAFSKKD